MSTDGRRKPRLRWWWNVVGVICLVPIAVAGVGMYADTRESVSYRCAIDDPQAGVLVSERALVRADVTFIPVGRSCTWQAAAGGYITNQTGWTTSVFAWISTAILTALALVSTQRDRPRALIVLATAAVTMWLAIGWGALNF